MAEEKVMDQKEGPMMHIDGDHMRAMKMEPMAHGTPVHMEVHGHVAGVGSHEDEKGEAHHHMTIKVHKVVMKGKHEKRKSTGEKLYGSAGTDSPEGEGET